MDTLPVAWTFGSLLLEWKLKDSALLHYRPDCSQLCLLCIKGLEYFLWETRQWTIYVRWLPLAFFRNEYISIEHAGVQPSTIYSVLLHKGLGPIFIITVKCHLSGRHLSEHVGYPTVGSTKCFWLPDIQNLIVVPLIALTRYLPVEYMYMDHTISSDLRCNETCMRQGSLLPSAQNM